EGASRVRGAPSPSALAVGDVRAGAYLTVTAWATDTTGQAWYRVLRPPGWIGAEAVNLLPGGGSARLGVLRGLGMWCTPPVLDTAPPDALIAAARHAHVSHLYVEVVGSRGGILGTDELRRLLPVAHAAHIAVIAWVYPFLDNLPDDVAMTLQAARYTAPD